MVNVFVVIHNARLRSRPQYAGEIRKRSIIFTVRSIVHTNPRRKRSFSNHTLSKTDQKNLKTPTLRFRVDEKHSESGGFQKR